jgi:chromate transporter
VDAGHVHGVGAAVIDHRDQRYKLTAKNIGKDKLLWAIYLVTVAITV